MFQNEIDEVVLGDYLANFENMSVELPPIIEDKTTSTLFSKEELLEQIRNQYTNLKKQEKTACIVANSFLSPCLEILQTIPEYESSSISEIISQLVLNQKLDIFNSCYATLDYYANAKIRVKYLSMVKTDTFEKFLLSLIEVLLVLKKIRMEVDATFYGYYHNKERKILPISLKNIPFYKNTCSYIGEIKEHTPIYYSPVAIIRNIDILDTNELVVRENESVYLLTERVQFTTLDSSCSVVKYAKDKVSKKKDFIVIENMKEKEKYIYYSDIITERKDGDQNE